MKIKGWPLAYFQTGEWQVIQEKLNDEMGNFNPSRHDLFAGLRAVPLDQVRVAILGQDPYPQRMHCTGLAFSVPAGIEPLPPSLVNIFKEYEDDLGYPAPKNGDLTKWCERGVLLWNVYPSCATGKPGSHHWCEWEELTKEIVEKLNAKETPVVFVACGSVAASFIHGVDPSHCIITSHPSPLGVNRGFRGSKIYSRTNTCLANLGLKPIDWRLEGEKDGKSQRVDNKPERGTSPAVC